MSMKRAILFSALCYWNFHTGHSLKPSSKIDFQQFSTSHQSNADQVETFDVSKETDNDGEIETLSKTDKIIQNGQFGESVKSGVVCNTKQCVVSFHNDEDGSSTKSKKITDVHVRISTDVDESSKPKSPPEEDFDVPIFKGYAGVHPKDIKDDNPINTKTTQSPPPVISLSLEPPKYEPNNWFDYLDRKSRTSTTTQRPISRPEFHPYNVGQPGHRDDQHIIPPGWSSAWKPISGNQNPGDYYHYNVNNNEHGFVDRNPEFVTYCSCKRKPVLGRKTVYHTYPRSWIRPETTTKIELDGKLAPPFRNNQ